MSKVKFKHESLEDNTSIIPYLKTMRDFLVKGSLDLGDGHSRFMGPQGSIKLGIKAQSKKGIHQLALRLEWKNEKNGESHPSKEFLAITPAKAMILYVPEN